ncbi:hypothetical protein Daus18300_002220 [Diaporthe australafricana]|uniref:Uncharacterized protein n=1 Tax=Diaporthe australafricana TaxID=127596 RepID=A0ABR3XQJ9_9PEZI
MDKNIILALVVDIIKIRSLQNKDAMAIFGNNTDTVDRFFASPSVIDRVYHFVVQKLAGEFLQKFTQSFDGTEIPQACYDFPALEPGLQCPNWREE